MQSEYYALLFILPWVLLEVSIYILFSVFLLNTLVWSLC